METNLEETTPKPIENETNTLPPVTVPEKRKKIPVKKKVKRKKIREEGEPKMPLTGYVRFMNERREKLRLEYPSKTAIEHTKMIGEEWNTMVDDAKAPYLKAYLSERAKYNEELNEFKKTKPLSIDGQENNTKQPSSSSSSSTVAVTTATATATNQNKTITNGKKQPLKVQTNGGTSASSSETTNINNSLDNCKKLQQSTATTTTNRPSDNKGIQIFTDEFLDHNKIVEIELRSLRKSNIDYEQQNSALEKHIENMKCGVEKIENENRELEEKNNLLQTYLDKLKIKLSTALSGLAIPNEPEGATVDNIDKYMIDLYGMVASNSHGPASLNKAKDIIRKLDLNIQL